MRKIYERAKYAFSLGKRYLRRALIPYKGMKSLLGTLDRVSLLEDSVRRCFYGLLRTNLATDFIVPKPLACLVCGEKQDANLHEVHAQCMFTSTALRRFRCECCGTIFGPVSLIECVPEHLADLYTLLYRYFKEGDTENYQERAFFELQPEKGKRYLNFACGTWRSGIEKLRAMGFDVYGYEPSLERQHEAICTTLNEAVQNGPFDGIFTHNFIEHVQNPFEFFSQIRALSKPGAKIAHSSACYDYRYEGSPFHLFFLSHSALEIIGNASGHKILNRVDHDLELPGHEVTIYTFIIDDASAEKF